MQQSMPSETQHVDRKHFRSAIFAAPFGAPSGGGFVVLIDASDANAPSANVVEPTQAHYLVDEVFGFPFGAWADKETDRVAAQVTHCSPLPAATEPWESEAGRARARESSPEP